MYPDEREYYGGLVGAGLGVAGGALSSIGSLLDYNKTVNEQEAAITDEKKLKAAKHEARKKLMLNSLYGLAGGGLAGMLTGKFGTRAYNVYNQISRDPKGESQDILRHPQYVFNYLFNGVS